VSASEWTLSASMEADPVATQAASLAQAIPRLAKNAARMARRLPSLIEPLRETC